MTSRRRTWRMNSAKDKSGNGEQGMGNGGHSAAGGRQPALHHSGVGAWVDHHVYSIVASLGRLLRRPWATVLTVGVMAVALALPLGLWLVLGNVARFSGQDRKSTRLNSSH